MLCLLIKLDYITLNSQQLLLYSCRHGDFLFNVAISVFNCYLNQYFTFFKEYNATEKNHRKSMKSHELKLI